MSTASPWRTAPPWRPAPAPSAVRRPSAAARRLRRALRRARRPAVALLLAAATGLVVHAALGEPEGARGVPVVVAVRDLPAGSDVAEGTETALLPASAVPQGALVPADAAGARLASPVREGEVLTDVRLTGTSVLASLEPGQVALPVAVTSPLPGGLVGPGDRVSVLAGDQGAGFDDGDGAGARGRVLVDAAAVLVVSSDATTTGLLTSGPGSTVVVLALDEDDAARVAAAASGSGVALAVTR